MLAVFSSIDGEEVSRPVSSTDLFDAIIGGRGVAARRARRIGMPSCAKTAMRHIVHHAHATNTLLI